MCKNTLTNKQLVKYITGYTLRTRTVTEYRNLIHSGYYLARYAEVGDYMRLTYLSELMCIVYGGSLMICQKKNSGRWVCRILVFLRSVNYVTSEFNRVPCRPNHIIIY